MFKDKLIEIRKENGDTQELLGKKINVSRSLVAKWEQGRAYPGYDEIEHISEIYNKPIEFLLSKYELKEVYGFYKKNNKIKTGIIIGISSLLVLAIITIIVFVGNLNFQTIGRKIYTFDNFKETAGGYEITEVDTGKKIKLSSKNSIKFEYFGNELDEKLNLNKMNFGYLDYEYYMDFFGLAHRKKYTVKFASPVLEDMDFTECIYVNLKGPEHWNEFDEDYCLYMRFKDVNFSDGRTVKMLNTNADESETVTKNGSLLDGEFCFYLDVQIFEEYHHNRQYQGNIIESYIYGDGRLDYRHYNPIFDKDVNFDDFWWGEKREVINVFPEFETFSWYSYPGGSYERNSVVFDSGDKTACHFDYRYNFKNRKNPEKYEIIECDANDSLIAKTDVKNFDEFENLVFNERTDHVYCNECINGEVTNTKRFDKNISISFANEVGRFVTKSKAIKAEN